MLGLPIDAGLLDQWRAWLAPAVQPFFVERADEWRGASGVSSELTDELRDTFKVWRISDRGEIVWLDEPSFLGMCRDDRRRLVRSQHERRRGAVPSVPRWADLLEADTLRAQADGHRFVWWPSLVGRAPELVLQRFAEEEADAARHGAPPPSVWSGCADVLPRARELAGTFSTGSGANCFGTVMAAAGVVDADERWMQQSPFEEWLASACVPGGRDDRPGTVLVWRDGTGLPVHAAVTLGEGYVLEKAAQTWWTPRIVTAVGTVKRASRAPGQRLERHRIERRPSA